VVVSGGPSRGALHLDLPQGLPAQGHEEETPLVCRTAGRAVGGPPGSEGEAVAGIGRDQTGCECGGRRRRRGDYKGASPLAVSSSLVEIASLRMYAHMALCFLDM